jgi:glutathione S-transferase
VVIFESDYVQSSVATLRHWLLTGKGKNRSKEMLASKHNAPVKVLSILDRTLRDKSYLTRHEYTIADMSVFSYVHLSEDAGISLEDYSAVQRWIDRVQGQPGLLNEVHPYSMDEYSAREL